jgi:hypothetical protein
MNIVYKKKLTGYFTIAVSSLVILMNQSCKQENASVKFARKWTAELKTKILEESDQVADKTTVDSVKRIITLYKDNLKLKQYYFADREHEGDGPIGPKIYDTVLIVFFSKGQDYQFVINPCVNKVSRRYETVAYKNNSFGMVEYTECGSGNKEIGFHFNNDNVGPWIKYDSDGKEIERNDAGGEEKLEKLREMKY